MDLKNVDCALGYLIVFSLINIFSSAMIFQKLGFIERDISTLQKDILDIKFKNYFRE